MGSRDPHDVVEQDEIYPPWEGGKRIQERCEEPLSFFLTTNPPFSKY